MEFDMNRVGDKDTDNAFFKKHNFEVTVECMRLEPNSGGIIEHMRMENKIKAMNTVAEKYEYGPFAHLCDSCNMDSMLCNATNNRDIMYGWSTRDDNVCFCRKYTREEDNEGKSTIETETTDPGPAS